MPPAIGAPQYPPPDGGWGWVVVFGAFISIGFSYAFPKAITVFFKEIQEIFHTSYSEIAWISSIMLAVMYAGGKTFVKFGNTVWWFFFCVLKMFKVNYYVILLLPKEFTKIHAFFVSYFNREYW